MARKFDDTLLDTDVLDRRLIGEANFESGEDTRFWVAKFRANGMPEMKARGLNPPVSYQVMACDLGTALNDMIHHDGAWLVAWTDPLEPTIEEALLGAEIVPQRMILLWIDDAGDPQFTIEIVERFADIVECGILHWVEQAEDGWKAWHWSMREVLDPNPEQLYNRAMGQRPPSLSIH